MQSGRGVAAAVEWRRGTVWFDYTDLANCLEEERALTDFYRGQIGIFHASLLYNAEIGEERGRIGTCCFDQQRSGWVALPETLLAQVCRTVCHAGGGAETGDNEAWKPLNGRLRPGGLVSAPFASGDVLLDVGSSWESPYYRNCVNTLKCNVDMTITWITPRKFPQRALSACGADPAPEFKQEVRAIMQMVEFELMVDTAARA